jgi:hypothetical protein
MHLHFFGRARSQIHQVRGQHISLFPKGHPIYDGHIKPFKEDEAERLKVAIENISQEKKYVRMAELAGLK